MYIWVTRPSLLKSTDPKLFLRESAKNYNFKNFFVSVSTTTSCICQLKSHTFASSVPFNVIEMA